MFIVAQGRVLIYKKTSGDNQQILASYIAGDCFNEINLFEDSPSQATAYAEMETELLILNYEGLISIMMEDSRIAARILHELLCNTAGRIRQANSILAEKTRQTEKIKLQEITDQLTGHYNRIYLDTQLDKELSDFGDNISVLSLKMDRFKVINDTFGHDAGDLVLKKLSETLVKWAQKKDRILRYRGNEFIAILPHTEKYPALIAGESFRKKVSVMDIGKITGGKKKKITVSIGVASFPEHGGSIREVITRAYRTMQEILISGGNRVDYS